MRPAIESFGLTDRGRVRSANEDQFLIADLDKSLLLLQTSLPEPDHTRLFGGPQGHLYAVADGMGGHSGGERASGLVVSTLVRYVLGTLPWFYRLGEQDHDLGDELRAAVEACQDDVAKAGGVEPGHGRMGTTLTLAYVLWPRVYVVHAGDSRAYLVRGGHPYRLTTDHTFAQKMIAEGRATPEQVEGTVLTHTLYKCISADKGGVAADIHKSRLRPGDTLLLCSDGLHGEVPDERIAELLAGGTAEEAARRLVDAANAAGGNDNVTVVVVRFPTTMPDPPTVRRE
jgi:protein phosphatase